MSLEQQNHLEPEMPSPAAIKHVYHEVWRAIDAQKAGNSDDFDDNTINTYAGLLRSYGEATPLVSRSIPFYYASFALDLLPILTQNQESIANMSDEEFTSVNEIVQETATYYIHDILHAFDEGVDFNTMTALDGLLHELTPIALYSHGDTLLLPASDIEDANQKTDVHAYRKDGATVRHQAVQCKRSKQYTAPIPNVALVDAQDYGNRVRHSQGIDRLYNTSHLLVEKMNGIDIDEAHLATFRNGFWEMIDNRLTTRFQHTQQQHYRMNIKSLQFTQRIHINDEMLVKLNLATMDE